MASTPIILNISHSASHGPDHFNSIINQSFLFINEQGANLPTTVYKAAHAAEAIGKKLQERVIYHYNATKGKKYDPLGPQVEQYFKLDEYGNRIYAKQYDKLDELCKRITAVVMLIKQDIGAFKADENPPTTSRVISTLEDVKRVSEELTGIAVKIKAKFLTGGYIFWYLPDYIKALQGMNI